MLLLLLFLPTIKPLACLSCHQIDAESSQLLPFAGCRINRSRSSRCSLKKTRLRAYAEALTLARALRSSKRRCFLRRMTLKRSKSVRADRFACTSLFLAQLEFFHFWSISDFSQYFLTVAVRVARGRPVRTKSVRTTLERDTDWRGTARAASEAGPSTRACSMRMQC